MISNEYLEMIDQVAIWNLISAMSKALDHLSPAISDTSLMGMGVTA